MWSSIAISRTVWPAQPSRARWSGRRRFLLELGVYLAYVVLVGSLLSGLVSARVSEQVASQPASGLLKIPIIVEAPECTAQCERITGYMCTTRRTSLPRDTIVVEWGEFAALVRELGCLPMSELVPPISASSSQAD